MTAEHGGSIEPLRLAFRVQCSPGHAFVTWTERIAAWWPADHTASGEENLEVVLEGRIGGRVFERTASQSRRVEHAPPPLHPGGRTGRLGIRIGG